MTQIKFTKRVQIGLLIGLIALNIILRIPTTPHEIGFDSFEMHALANSISLFGEARWWAHPLSVVGFYPLSYASTVPFILSGISQCTILNVELIILLYSFFLGIFSIFGAYLLARMIWDNDIFEFLVAFAFSTSQGILTFSTWTANARTLYVIILPMSIYLLLKIKTFRVRCSILAVMILILLFTTHNYISFTIPLIIAYFIVVIIYKLGKYINVKATKNHENFINNIINFTVLASFLIMFSVPFLISRELWMMDPETVRAGVGSRYALLPFMLRNYARYIGFLSIFVVGGYVYLLLKREKRFEEWFLLAAMVCLAPFLYVTTYMKWFIATFAFLLIGIALTNIAIAGTQTKRRLYNNMKLFLLVGILLSSTIFTGYYQDIHFTINPPSHYDRYMKEQTYTGGLWIRDNIDENEVLLHLRGEAGLRTFAISGVPILMDGPIALSYGFYKSVNDLNLTRNSPLSLAFYRQGPIIKRYMTPFIGGHINIMQIHEYNCDSNKRFLSKYNISYMIEDEKTGYNAFVQSIHLETNSNSNMYDNGKIRIWSLKL